jgi:7-carboxy-7-deazaguanine synthase
MDKKELNKLFRAGTHLPLIEKFYTLQGEGYHTGKAAFFIRIGGCDIGCQWCDTKYSWTYGIDSLVESEKLAREIIENGYSDVVVTGGEPTLYNLDIFTSILKNNGVKTYLETSGTNPLTGKWDWICLSPKTNQPPLPEFFASAQELKVIIYNLQEDLQWAEENAKKVLDGTYLYLQPEWSRRKENTPQIIEYIKKNPKWKLSVQLHKYLGIP